MDLIATVDCYSFFTPPRSCASLDYAKAGAIFVERLARQRLRENICKVIGTCYFLESDDVAIHKFSTPEVRDLDMSKARSNDGIVGDVHCALRVTI